VPQLRVNGVLCNGTGSFNDGAASSDSTLANMEYYTMSQDDKDLVNGDTILFVLTSTGNGGCDPVKDTVGVGIRLQPIVTVKWG